MDSRTGKDADKIQYTYTDWLNIFPNEVLSEIFSHLDHNEAAIASTSDANDRINLVMQDVWRLRTRRHFPEEFSDDRSQKITNWINEFNEIQSRVYTNFDGELSRLHYLMKEERIAEILAREHVPLHYILQCDSNGNSLLSLAARSNYQHLLNLYYQFAFEYFSGSYPHELVTDARDIKQNSILHWAIFCNQPLEEISALILQGCDVNGTNELGETPLMTAVQSRRIDVLKVLAGVGADIHKPNLMQQAPVCAAAINGDTATLEFLLDHGADINTDHLGDTLLHLAGKNRHTDLTKCLIRRGIDIEATDLYGRTALQEAVDDDNLNILKVLLEQGANINARDLTLKTPLHHATEAGNKRLVNYLLANGAHPDAADRCELVTALHLAAKSKDPEMMEILLERCVKVNAVMKNGSTPLFIAACFGHAKTVELLLKKGANMALAKNNRHKLSLLFAASMNGNIDIVSVLLKHNVNINETCIFGRTPLYIAVKRNHIHVVQKLLEQGADPNIVNTEGRSPLHIAAKRGDMAMTRLLLKHGADIKIELPRSGLTAYDLALKHKQHQAAYAIEVKIQGQELDQQVANELEASSIQLPCAPAARANRLFDFFNRRRSNNTPNNNNHHRHRR